MIIVPNRSCPIIIPRNTGDASGGGGGDIIFYCAAICGTAFLGLGIMAHQSLPRVQMKFAKSAYGYSLMVRSINLPCYIRIDNNIHGLKFKEHIMRPSNILQNHYECWQQVMYIETPKSFEEFKEDCTKHDVHTIINYKYCSLIFEREITKQKKFYWHRQMLV
jgi:hypothetical protein